MALNLSVPRTRLLVRTMTDGRGRTVPTLADADGAPLPMQRRVQLDYDAEGNAEITVTFFIDGDYIRQVPDRFRAGE